MISYPAPRSADEIAHEWAEDLFPPGTALKGPNIRSLLRVLAEPRATLERDSTALAYEICPGSSALLLDDYRTLLGADPYGRDQGELTEDQWRFLLQQRWTARGNQTPAFYIALAQSYDATISITEPEPPICGPTICGGGLQVAEPTLRFTWIVDLPADVLKAICGDAICGMMELAQEEQNTFTELKQIFRLLKPADTEVSFRHDGVWIHE